MKAKKKKKLEKLNLIPILDAIFIFIFFLLMSAQFIDIYQLETEAPVTQAVSKEEIKDKEPLNLKVIINDKNVVIKTGLSTSKSKSFDSTEEGLKNMQQYLTKLKKSHPKEKTVTVAPKNKVTYKKIVPVIDKVKTATDKGIAIELFSLVVFEN